MEKWREQQKRSKSQSKNESFLALFIVLVLERDTGVGKRTRVPILCTAISGMIAGKLHKGTGLQLQLQNYVPNEMTSGSFK